ncbi:hypothetical protein T12_14985, partial [Trichinella patagoniensis]
LYEDIILLPRNISWQKNRSSIRKQNTMLPTDVVDTCLLNIIQFIEAKYSGVKLHAGKENRKTYLF